MGRDAGAFAQFDRAPSAAISRLASMSRPSPDVTLVPSTVIWNRDRGGAESMPSASARGPVRRSNCDFRPYARRVHPVRHRPRMSGNRTGHVFKLGVGDDHVEDWLRVGRNISAQTPSISNNFGTRPRWPSRADRGLDGWQTPDRRRRRELRTKPLSQREGQPKAREAPPPMTMLRCDDMIFRYLSVWRHSLADHSCGRLISWAKLKPH